MMNVPENELFSAYLDGELTAAEQADVERLLADSPAARQLMDELRALSSTLQSLSAHKLDEDLSQQVLRLAEERILSGGADCDPFPLEPVGKSDRWRAIGRRLSRPRTWLWPAVAAAVAGVLAMLHSEHGERVRPPAERPVALAPAALPKAPSEPPAIGAAVEARRERGGEGLDWHLRMPGDSDGRKLSEHRVVESAPAEAKRVVADEITRPSAAPMAAAASTPLSAAPSFGAAKAPAPAAGAVAGPGAAVPAEVPARPMKAFKEGQMPPMRPAKGELAEPVPVPPEQIVIVHCDVTREALQQRIVEKVLAGRQIALAGRPEGKPTDHEESLARQPASTRDKAKKDAVALAPGAAEPAEKVGADSGATVRLVAEATPVQLKFVIADLQSRPEMVRSLSIRSLAAGTGADRTDHFSFGHEAPVGMKKSGMAFGAQAGAYGGAEAFQIPVPTPGLVQNQAAEAESARGKREASSTQTIQDQPGLMNAAESASTANRRQEVAGQRRMPAAAGRSQEMGQRVIEATQAGGTRKAGRGGMALDEKEERAKQAEQQASQAPTQYCVVFILRAVDSPALAAEKAVKAPAGEAKAAASAKPSPADAARMAEPAKPAPAASAPPAAKAAK